MRTWHAGAWGQYALAHLLELGSGFQPDYTGLANIDLAAALLGFIAFSAAAKESAEPGTHTSTAAAH